MKKWVSWLSRFLVGWWIDSALIKEIKGLDNFPPDRNFIFAQNHLSYMDLFIDGYICSPRRFTYIGQVDKLTGIKGFCAIYCMTMLKLFGLIAMTKILKKSR